jgi:hypothetical protein
MQVTLIIGHVSAGSSIHEPFTAVGGLLKGSGVQGMHQAAGVPG